MILALGSVGPAHAGSGVTTPNRMRRVGRRKHGSTARRPPAAADSAQHDRKRAAGQRYCSPRPATQNSAATHPHPPAPTVAAPRPVLANWGAEFARARPKSRKTHTPYRRELRPPKIQSIPPPRHAGGMATGEKSRTSRPIGRQMPGTCSARRDVDASEKLWRLDDPCAPRQNRRT